MAAATAVVLGVVLPQRTAHKAHAPAPAARTNVVLITVDTFRADYLHSLGQGQQYTKSLDKLAERGVLFHRCISAASVTGPSVTSIMTGDYPVRTGVQYNMQPLPDSLNTLARVLKGHGYHTAGFVATTMLARKQKFNLGFDEFTDRVDQNYAPGHYERSAEDLTADVLTWLRAQPADRPFFLWVHYFDPHFPYQKRFGPDAGETWSCTDLDFLEDLDSEAYQTQVGKIAGAYRQEIFYTDRYIGNLLEAIRARGLLDNTLIVATADHGEELFEYGRYCGHAASLHDVVLNVPLIMSLPGGEHAGGHVRDVIRSIDIFPTVLDILDLSAPAPVQGQSLLPRIQGTSDAAAPPAVSQRAPHDFHPGGPASAVTTDTWKYIQFERADNRLYDLKDDPREFDDLIADEPAVVQQMQRRLADHRKAAGAKTTRKPPRLSPKQKRALKSLGYIE